MVNLGATTLQIANDQTTGSATILLNGGGIEGFLYRDSSVAQTLGAQGGVYRTVGSGYSFELLGNSVRLLREGSYALIGADAVRKALAATDRRVVWTPAGAGTSASDDMGFTYGRYARFVGSVEESTGYYIHVWQRDDAGSWRIAAEVQLPPG